MDIDSLETRLSVTSAKFDSLTREKTQLSSKIDDISIELIKLQGEARGYKSLIEENRADTTSDAANTITPIEETQDSAN